MCTLGTKDCTSNALKVFKTTRWVLFPQEHILLISRYKLIKINTTVREISVSLSFKTSYLWVYVYVCVKARYRLHILLWIYVVFVDSRNAYTFRYFSPSLQVSIWILDLIKYCVWRALTILTTIAYWSSAYFCLKYIVMHTIKWCNKKYLDLNIFNEQSYHQLYKSKSHLFLHSFGTNIFFNLNNQWLVTILNVQITANKLNMYHQFLDCKV